jgi:hypothetical protein
MPKHLPALSWLTVVLGGCPLPDDICELDPAVAPPGQGDVTCDVEREDAVITIRREVDDDLRLMFRLDLSGASRPAPRSVTSSTAIGTPGSSMRITATSR